MTPQSVALTIAYELYTELPRYDVDCKYWVEDFKVNGEWIINEYPHLDEHWEQNLGIEGVEGLERIWKDTGEEGEWFWNLVKQSAIAIARDEAFKLLEGMGYEVRIAEAS